MGKLLAAARSLLGQSRRDHKLLEYRSDCIAIPCLLDDIVRGESWCGRPVASTLDAESQSHEVMNE
jgi:hypothetical protein